MCVCVRDFGAVRFVIVPNFLLIFSRVGWCSLESATISFATTGRVQCNGGISPIARARHRAYYDILERLVATPGVWPDLVAEQISMRVQVRGGCVCL